VHSRPQRVTKICPVNPEDYRVGCAVVPFAELLWTLAISCAVK